MTENLLDYIKQLCTEHNDFNHAADNKAYFEFDYQTMLEARNRNKVVLYVHKIQGKFDDNQGDYKTDLCYLTIHIVQKVPSKSLALSREEMLACKTYGEEFFARMRYDRQESLDADICKMLRNVYLDDITYEQLELTADGWTGIQFRIPFRMPIEVEYDATKWINP